MPAATWLGQRLRIARWVLTGSRDMTAWFLPTALVGAASIYLPNLNGGFVFDDYPNFAANPDVKLTSLDVAGWLDVLFSGWSGPLGRPVAMLSFALNYYLGGLESFYFKFFNLGLHLLCGLLCWRLALGLLRRVPNCTDSTARYAAAATAAIWLLHPMHLTVVLYTVQRMTSLSTLFCLAGMLCYLSGRERVVRQQPGAAWRIMVAFALFTPLAILSKENGALLPLYLLLIEVYFFRAGNFGRLPGHWLTGTFACTVLLPVLAATVWVYWRWDTLHVGVYREYDHGPGSRLLTQTRVLWQYLQMIFLPASDWFTLHHDDIRISWNLWTPWTTLPATAGMVGLAIGAWLLRKRAQVASFGIALFLVGHLVESTVLPLEAVYEHRNYLPAFGLLLVLCYYFSRPHPFPATLPLRRLALPVLAVLCALVTWPRADAWGRGQPYVSLYELQHNPRSARLHTDLAAYYAHRHVAPDDPTARLENYQRAAHHLDACKALNPGELACLGYRHYIAGLYGQPADPAWLQRIGVLLEDAALGPADISVIGWLIHSCEHACEAHDRRMEDYAASLNNNPRVVPHGRRNIYVAFADYYLRKRKLPGEAWTYMARALSLPLSPRERFKTRTKLVEWLAEAGFPGLALAELDALVLGYPLRTRTRSFLELHARMQAIPVPESVPTRYTGMP